MQFEVALQDDVADVKLQPEPGGPAGLAAGGENAAWFWVGIHQARCRAQVAAGRDKCRRESGVEHMPAEAQRRGGQFLDARRLGAVKPRDLPVLQRILQVRAQAEPGDGSGREAGDKLPANAMPRIVAGLENDHGYAGPPQGEAEGESREAATDDFDRARRIHARLTAIIR